MKKIFTLSLLTICLQISASACSCIYYASFCESTTTESIVVEVEVLEKYSSTTDEFLSFMDVSFIEVINGETNQTNLTVVDYGTSCDVNQNQFTIGDHLILRFINLETIDGANYGTLSMGGCSESFLKVNDGMVTGLINPDLNSQSLEDFKTGLMTCVDLTLFDRNLELLNENVIIYPNPTYGDISVSLYFSNSGLDLLSYQLYAITGQAIGEGTLAKDNRNISLGNLPNGVYFLKIRYKENFIVRKIIKR